MKTMRLALLAAAALCLGTLHAGAADLRLRAAPAVAAAPACTVDYCVGWFAGFDISGVATSLNFVGQGIGGSFNGGGTLIGGHGGYRAWNGKLYMAGEAGCNYDVSSGTGGLGVGFSDRLGCSEVVKLGGSLSALLGTQPFTFPAALQPYLMSVYAIAGAKQRMGGNGIVGGAGAEFVITPHATVTLEYRNVSYKGGTSDVPGLVLKDENLAVLGFNWAF